MATYFVGNKSLHYIYIYKRRMASRGSCLRLCNTPPSLLLHGLHSGTWMIGSRILKQVGNQLRLQENLRYKYSPLQSHCQPISSWLEVILPTRSWSREWLARVPPETSLINYTRQFCLVVYRDQSLLACAGKEPLANEGTCQFTPPTWQNKLSQR